MAVNTNFLKLYNVMGNYKNFLSSRIILPSHQPIATLRKSIEEKLGLPVKPKRPLTPYFNYMKEMRPKLLQKYPDFKLVDITRMMAKEWQTVDPSIKAKYKEQYTKDLEEYSKARMNYDSSITEEQKKLLKQAKIDAQLQKDIKLYQGVVTNLGKPKKPRNAFSIYVRSLAAKRGDMKISDWQRLMLSKWKALPESEKIIYENEAFEALKVYNENLQLWKEKIAQMDKHDLAALKVQVKKGPKEKKSEE